MTLRSFNVVHAAAEYTPTRPLTVEGIGVYGRDNSPLRFESVASVTPAAEDPLEQKYERVRTDIEEHAQLVSGWLGDGEGELVSRAAIAVTRVFVDRIERLGVTPPNVYPTPEGGLQLEWTAGPYELSAEVAPDGTISVHSTDAVDGEGGRSARPRCSGSSPRVG